MSARPTLLAVAHGTSDRTGIRVLESLVDRVRTRTTAMRVELAYVDHAEPSVSAALDRLAGDGAPVVVVPLLLTAASHSKGDLPGAIQVAQRRNPGWVLRYAAPLGPHRLLVSLVDRRLREAAVPDAAAVVLAAAGAADPDANAQVARVARLLFEWRRTGPVEAAYASVTGPTVPQAVDRLRLLGYHQVAVAPYFLAPGRLPVRVADAARAAGDDVWLTGLLGDADEVAAVVLERYEQAAAGDVRMSCETCLYRTPWPGHESLVGTPQTVHAHPAD